MTILVSGGGTAGHITPILAVARELKQQDSDCRVVYVGEHGGKFKGLTKDQPDIDEVFTVFAGKLRRYHGESWFKRICDIPTNLRNLRDIFYILFGILQSIYLLHKIKPAVIFLKGGYVGVPIGLAAALWRIPFITHDSDALPGLANRLTSRWAKYHATGMPPEFYNYPKDSIRYTGVLVGEQFKPVDDNLQNDYRQELGLSKDSLVLVVTGGSLGAERLNQAFGQIAERLLKKYPKLHIIHQVGKGHLGIYDKISSSGRTQELEFMEGMERYTGAADVVVTRAGANTLAELGVQGKACVVVPNPLLTAGHQLKNVEYLLGHNAVLSIDETAFETDTTDLKMAIEHLLDDPASRRQLGQALNKLVKPLAAKTLAGLLIETAKG